MGPNLCDSGCAGENSVCCSMKWTNTFRMWFFIKIRNNFLHLLSSAEHYFLFVGLPPPDLSFQRGVRYTYRYSTTITTSLYGSSAGRNGLALDCVVDIDVVSKCHLMMQVSLFKLYIKFRENLRCFGFMNMFIQQIRNPQIKRLSPQKEHSVQRLKSLR